MYIESLSIAVLAVVISEVISAPGDILAFYRRFLEWLFNKGLGWVAKPIGYCPKYLSGQLALWIFFFLPGYNVLDHIFFIAWSIFFAEILTIIYGKISV